MSRRQGSKNAHGYHYSKDRMKKKCEKLANDIDKFIDVAYNNYTFNKLVDFNKLHQVKDDLLELVRLKMD